jgi:quercetin dioxygenase-like cupin family protein
VADHRRDLVEAVERLQSAVSGNLVAPQTALRLTAFLHSITRQVVEGEARATFTRSDGSLILSQWADGVEFAGRRWLEVGTGERSHAMSGTTATGEPLVSNGHLGVDLIRVPAGGGFAPHTHVGDHLLIIVAGTGTVAYEGRIYRTQPGQVYLVEGAKPHAVGAVTDHVLLAVGTPHRAVDATDRQTVVAYEAVAAKLGDLHCELCGVSAVLPQTLHDAGCPHCPSRFEAALRSAP